MWGRAGWSADSPGDDRHGERAENIQCRGCCKSRVTTAWLDVSTRIGTERRNAFRFSQSAIVVVLDEGHDSIVGHVVHPVGWHDLDNCVAHNSAVDRAHPLG